MKRELSKESEDMAINEQKYPVDALTKVWSWKAAKDYIEEHLKDSKEYEGDAIFLVHLEQWAEMKASCGIEAGNSILQQLSFLMGKLSQRSDFISRIGEASFLVFSLGCNSREKIIERIQRFYDYLEDIRFLQGQDLKKYTYVGAVLCHGKELDSECLLKKAEQALALSLRSEIKYAVIGEQEPVEVADASSSIKPIPEYHPKDNYADMEFISQFTDLLFACQDSSMAVDMALESLCRYFCVEYAYITELSADKKCYCMTYECDKVDRLVVNENLKDSPCLIMEGYQELFDKNNVFVCNRIQELQRGNPYMAERQKLRGTQSLIQSAILESGKFIGYIGICELKTERLWKEEEIFTFTVASRILAADVLQNRYQRYTSRIAYKDLLTEAWNLKKFLSEAQRRLDTPGHQAIVTFDIKDFKAINIEFGYGEGNLVLIEISDMLRMFAEEDECYARIEADRFVLLLRYEGIPELQKRVKRLLSHVERLSVKLGLDFPFVCMAGICLMEEEKESVQEMIERANRARMNIKDFHRSNYAFFNKSVELQRSKEKYYASQMKAALANGEFVVYYQPKVEVQSGKYAGLEALVRWKRPNGQIIQPDEFIPLFERNRFVIELDLYVFEQVCKVIHRWIMAGKVLCPIAVNLSRVHIQEPDFLEQMTAICGAYQISMGDIELELTESAFLDNPDMIVEIARKIKQKGFKLSMDDFGTGYSSLSMLKELPVDIIKLDRGFFKKTMSQREKVIISNVIRMAKELEIEVISEGIETKEHEQFLKEIGCNMAQGFLYAKPAPLLNFENLLGKEPGTGGKYK